jgi:hypothetical protein
MDPQKTVVVESVLPYAQFQCHSHDFLQPHKSETRDPKQLA